MARAQLEADATGLVDDPAARRRAAPPLAWLSLVLVYLFWGSTYLGIRVGVETIPPLAMAGTRFLVAGIVLYPIALVLGRRAGGRRERVGLAQWRAAAIVGVMLLALGNAAVGWAEQTVPSGLAALIVATVPLWLVLLDRFVNGARLGPAGVVGVSLGFAGVALLAWPSGTHEVDVVGIGVIVVASMSWAAGSLYAKRAPLPANGLLGAAMQMLTAGALLVVVSAAAGELDGLRLDQVSTRSLAAWAWLVVAGSIVGYSAYIHALTNLPTATAATYAYVNPVIAVLLGLVILAEPLTAQTLIAGIVIVGAVALIVTGQRRPEQHDRAATAGHPRPPLRRRDSRSV